VGISAVSQEARDRADAMLPGVPVLDVPTIVERSELVVLAVPAGQLADLVAGLAATGAWQPGQLVAHTAPGLGTAVLSPALGAGAIPLAISPAMAFTGTSVDLVRLRESWCAVTAPGPVLPIAQALVVEMGAEPVVVADADRAAYADALEAAAGFSTAVVSQAASALRGIGIEHPGRVLGSLVRSSVENALAAAESRADGPDAGDLVPKVPESGE
jgi:predicted short-subunit dehydrogenase-like oxidoreductase (DUF2520 family)